MTLTEAMKVVRQAFPNATVGDDLDGQIIIYTATAYSSSDELIPFPEESPEE